MSPMGHIACLQNQIHVVPWNINKRKDEQPRSFVPKSNRLKFNHIYKLHVLSFHDLSIWTCTSP